MKKPLVFCLAEQVSLLHMNEREREREEWMKLGRKEGSVPFSVSLREGNK